MQFVSTYVFYTFSTLLPSHSGVAAGLYINCTPPLEETSKQTNKQCIKFVYKNVGFEIWILSQKGRGRCIFQGKCLFQSTDCDPKRWQSKIKTKTTFEVQNQKQKISIHVLFWLKINCENQEIDCNQNPMLREILKRRFTRFFGSVFDFRFDFWIKCLLKILLKKCRLKFQNFNWN